MATVLVALAVTESSPSQMSVGNETSVPPPAMELMAPATNEAANATAACGASSAEVNLQDTARRRSALKIPTWTQDFAL
jgi:hypothetical protein